MVPISPWMVSNRDSNSPLRCTACRRAERVYQLAPLTTWFAGVSPAEQRRPPQVGQLPMCNRTIDVFPVILITCCVLHGMCVILQVISFSFSFRKAISTTRILLYHMRMKYPTQIYKLLNNSHSLLFHRCILFMAYLCPHLSNSTWAGYNKSEIDLKWAMK